MHTALHQRIMAAYEDEVGFGLCPHSWRSRVKKEFFASFLSELLSQLLQKEAYCSFHILYFLWELRIKIAWITRTWRTWWRLVCIRNSRNAKVDISTYSTTNMSILMERLEPQLSAIIFETDRGFLPGRFTCPTSVWSTSATGIICCYSCSVNVNRPMPLRRNAFESWDQREKWQNLLVPQIITPRF